MRALIMRASFGNCLPQIAPIHQPALMDSSEHAPLWALAVKWTPCIMHRVHKSPRFTFIISSDAEKSIFHLSPPPKCNPPE
ncbi:hypothetical protein CEXT_48551 [Caerostris extrusa]|uniref:Uncharacterized protein n=1 Tax=Caerostris extrusa TaxID=172846 RepID=A0AAV4N106_CAEEX|nr:hypothetical protein CEXT_48551 [Caerostris extrusa]